MINFKEALKYVLFLHANTKVWLSNDKYYIDGVADNVKKSDLTNNVLGINRCGTTY